MTSGPAPLKLCAPLLVAMVASAYGATSAETIASSPAPIAGGEVNNPSLAPPTETTQLAVSVGAGETDNVFLTGSPTQSQTLALVGLDFDLQRQGSALNIDTKGDFQYLDFLEHAFGSHLYGRFDGQASMDLVPGNVKWVVEDYFGQAQLDPFEPLTPENLENVNVFSTGPDFRVRLGATGFVELDLRYALSHYQISPFSGKRELANLAVGEELSTASSVSLNLDGQRLRFDDTAVNTDYDRREAYVRYDFRGARTGVDLDLGVSQSNEAETWVSAPLAKLSARRLLSPSLTLTLAVGHELTDASDGFRNLKSGATGGIVIAPVAGTMDTYLSNYGSAELRFQRNRTTIALSARWERDTFAQSAPTDITDGAVEAFFQRRMTPLLALQLHGSWGHIHYYNGGYYETDWPVGAAVLLSPGRRVDFKLSADHIRHNVTASGLSYTENRVFLVAEYRPWQ
jgi:hypothetical protein